ncbi:hypothetical protein GTR00_03405, partial [Kineococcus sp. T90]
MTGRGGGAGRADLLSALVQSVLACPPDTAAAVGAQLTTLLQLERPEWRGRLEAVLEQVEQLSAGHGAPFPALPADERLAVLDALEQLGRVGRTGAGAVDAGAEYRWACDLIGDVHLAAPQAWAPMGWRTGPTPP